MKLLLIIANVLYIRHQYKHTLPHLLSELSAFS